MNRKERHCCFLCCFCLIYDPLLSQVCLSFGKIWMLYCSATQLSLLSLLTVWLYLWLRATLILEAIVCDGCNCREPWDSHLHLFIQQTHFNTNCNYTSETQIKSVIQKCCLALKRLIQAPNIGSVVVNSYKLLFTSAEP